MGFRPKRIKMDYYYLSENSSSISLRDSYLFLFFVFDVVVGRGVFARGVASSSILWSSVRGMRRLNTYTRCICQGLTPKTPRLRLGSEPPPSRLRPGCTPELSLTHYKTLKHCCLPWTIGAIALLPACSDRGHSATACWPPLCIYSFRVAF